MATEISAFDGAVRLIQHFQEIQRSSSSVSEFFDIMKARFSTINDILNHPEANVIISLAMVHLVKNNQWQLLHLVHDYFRNHNVEAFDSSGWGAVAFHDKPLTLTEIKGIQKALFKVKDISLPVYYRIDSDVMAKAMQLRENEMIGIVASFRERNRQDPSGSVVRPYQFTQHRSPVLFQRAGDELRVYVTDSIVDKIRSNDGVDYVYPMQQDIIEQVLENAPQGVNIVFYRFPSVQEDRPETPKNNVDFFSKYKRQSDGESCGVFALQDLCTMYRLVKEDKMESSFSSMNNPMDPKIKILKVIPTEIMPSTQSLKMITQHPQNYSIMQKLQEKNCIVDGKNLLISRLRFKYHHLYMTLSDGLSRAFLQQWAEVRRSKLGPITDNKQLRGLDAFEIGAEIREMNFGQIIWPVFNKLSPDIKKKVYRRIWELHGGAELQTQDPNFGYNNLFKDMHHFYTALREAIEFQPVSENAQIGASIFPVAFWGALMQIPHEMRGQFYEEVWRKGGCQMGEDDWGKNHAFDDMPRFARAMEAFLLKNK